MAEALTAKQRQFLKGKAHSLSPVVRVGKGGLTPAVIEEAKTALRAHELVKVRIEADDSDDRRELAEHLAEGTRAQIVARVGKVAVLYRAREKDPGIRLPS